MTIVNGHQFFDFAVDCVCAWTAHQLGPHLPSAGFFRRYFSWLLPVVLVFPTQFVVYESYIVARPWYAYLIIYLLPIGAGAWWILFEFHRPTSGTPVEPGILLDRFPRIRHLAAPIFIGIPTAYILFTGAWIWWQHQPSDRRVIVVAGFAGPNPELYSPTSEILRDLYQLTRYTPDVEILPADAVLREEDGPNAAANLGTPLIGTRHTAALVLWGYYKVSPDHATVTGKIEILRKDFDLPRYTEVRPGPEAHLFDLRETRSVVPIERINNFEIQTRLAEAIRSRSLYVLALFRLSRREYESATALLDQANSGPDSDSSEVPGRAVKPITHAANGPLVDFQDSFSEARGGAHIAGKWTVLVARAYANIAQNLTRKALLDCAEAAFLSPQEPVPYYCLGHVHLKNARLEPDALRKKKELEKAHEDCSRAIERDPKFSDAEGCRGESDWWLAQLEDQQGYPLPSDKVAHEGLIGGIVGGVPRGQMGAALGGIVGSFGEASGRSYLRRAREEWSAYIKNHPTDPYGFESRAAVSQSLGIFRQAEADYTQAILLDKRSVSSWNDRGVLGLQAMLGLQDELPFVRPNAHEWISALKGSVSPKEREWEVILSDFESAVKLAPEEPAAWCNLGLAARLSNDSARAKKALNRCRELGPDAATRSWAAYELGAIN